MKNLSPRKQSSSKSGMLYRQYSYQELVDYLDGAWSDALKDSSLTCIKKLDEALGFASYQTRVIAVVGTNGKSLTSYFMARLLQQEGLSVGVCSSPHLLAYTERFSINNETISQKLFTDIANEVIGTAETLGLKPHAQDILTMIGFLYCARQRVDVALVECCDTFVDPRMISNAAIVAITRITDSDAQEGMEQAIDYQLSMVAKNTHVVSADQSKKNLQIMEKITRERQGIWSMPIRKLAPLPYPFEQLHGRSAALAERVAQLYATTSLPAGSIISNSLLVKQKGQRGRPTLEAKRQSGLHPQLTLAQFWEDIVMGLPARFQLLDKEKPAILLDIASNVDALDNVLLGIRLLHYQRPIKGIVIILAHHRDGFQGPLTIKQLRYFFKKMSGSLVICPLDRQGQYSNAAWDPEKVANNFKTMKIKARPAKSFADAFEGAVKLVDEQDGLIVITGSPAVIKAYWSYKGMNG